MTDAAKPRVPVARRVSALRFALGTVALVLAAPAVAASPEQVVQGQVDAFERGGRVLARTVATFNVTSDSIGRVDLLPSVRLGGGSAK